MYIFSVNNPNNASDVRDAICAYLLDSAHSEQEVADKSSLPRVQRQAAARANILLMTAKQLRDAKFVRKAQTESNGTVSKI